MEAHHAALRSAHARGRSDAIAGSDGREAPHSFPDGMNDPQLRDWYAAGWKEGAALISFGVNGAGRAPARGPSSPPPGPGCSARSARKERPMPKNTNAPKKAPRQASKLTLELRNARKTADGKLTVWDGYAGPVPLGPVVAKTQSAGMKQLRGIARKQVG